MRIPAWIYLGFWFLYQLFEGRFALVHPDNTGGSHVGFFAHVGGFAFGVLVAIILTLSGRITSVSTTAEAGEKTDPKAAEKTDPTVTQARCWVCQHVQVVPRGQPAFVCEQCGAKLERRTQPARGNTTA